IEQ
ncbi:phage shock protein A, partial [Vibrio harveyi]